MKQLSAPGNKPRVLQQSNISAANPYISATNPYISATKPYICNKQ